MVNKHGLPRTIPEPIKRQVRQRCGFGCVICGYFFIEYDHMSSPYADSVEHVADDITCLCIRHHGLKTKGIVSLKAVLEANANPCCLRNGFTNEFFEFARSPITVRIGGMTFTDVDTLIEINGVPVVSIRPPEDSHGPPRLSATFTDERGVSILRITDNEFRATTQNWDVTSSGTRIELRSGPVRISLILRVGGANLVEVERLEMEFMGVRLRANADELEISRDGGRRWDRYIGCSVEACKIGMSFRGGRMILPGEFGRTSLHLLP